MTQYSMKVTSSDLASEGIETTLSPSLYYDTTSSEKEAKVFANICHVSTCMMDKNNLANTESRLETYENWYSGNNSRPEELAEAGFCFDGFADSVRCFSCHGRLRNWEKTDDPWIEHARWFPHCQFVQQEKGECFLNIVQRLHSSNSKISWEMIDNEINKSR